MPEVKAAGYFFFGFMGAQAGFLADSNGEADSEAFGLICFGFFASRLPRRSLAMTCLLFDF
ncbi:MAG: hypothetical protein WBP94_01765 [Rhodomicrobiaceae bacterium]